MGIKGYVMNIQPFSVNDGDGIRTTVFLAGCPLRCSWCSNPEGMTMEEKVNAKTGESMVSLMDADEVLAKVQKHRLFYAYSGGGITFSGGEPTMQTEFLDYLSAEIYHRGYSMAIETSGMFDWDRVAHILGRMDLIFMDLKMMDDVKHLEYTGVSNKQILENIARIKSLSDDAEDVSRSDGAMDGGFFTSQGPEVVIRIPVVGGVNDDEDNIRSSAAYVNEHVPGARMELLPYHNFGTIKYKALGLPYEHPEFRTPGRAEMERLRQIVREEGVEIADFR